jgi:hypothetical protein
MAGIGPQSQPFLKAEDEKQQKMICHKKAKMGCFLSDLSSEQQTVALEKLPVQERRCAPAWATFAGAYSAG